MTSAETRQLCTLRLKKNSTFLTHYTCLHEKLAHRLSDVFSNKKFTESDALSRNHLKGSEKYVLESC